MPFIEQLSILFTVHWFYFCVPLLLHSVPIEQSITPRYPLLIDPNYAFHNYITYFGFFKIREKTTRSCESLSDLGVVWPRKFHHSISITHHSIFHIRLASSPNFHHSIFFTLFVGPYLSAGVTFSFFFFFCFCFQYPNSPKLKK